MKKRKNISRNIKRLLVCIGTIVGAIGLQWTIIEIFKEFYSPTYFEDLIISIPYTIGLQSIILGLITYVVYSLLDEKPILDTKTLGILGSALVSYENQQAAERDIIKDIKASKKISIFTMRGHSFILPERAFGFLPNQTNKEVRFCVANPKTKRYPNIHIRDRANEYENTTVESYWNDLNNDMLKIGEIINTNKNFICKLHLEPAVFRLFIFDSRVYFSFFKPYVSGSQLPIYRAENNSEFYIGFNRYFNKTWDGGKLLK